MNNCCNRSNCLAHISGVVIGVGGVVAGLPIEYIINGERFTTLTDAIGCYSFDAPIGSVVRIIPQIGLGVHVTPSEHYLCRVCESQCDLNFVLTPVTLQ